MEKLTEYNDEEDYGDVKYKLRHFTKFKILLIVTTIFIVLSIIFIILFAVEKSKDQEITSKLEKTPKPPKTPSVQGQTYCGSKTCLYASMGKI